jgi:hypothetical protein
MGSSKPQLRIKQFEVVYAGVLAEPLVRLLSPEGGVLDLFLKRLAPFGATIENAVYNPSWHNLAQAYLETKLLEGYGVLRLWPNLLELRYQSGAFGFAPPARQDVADQAAQLLSGAAAALRAADEHARLGSHSFTLSLHGQLTGEPVASFLGAFVKPPSGFGKVADAGAKYRFEPDDGGRECSLQIEPSLTIKPNGLYVSLVINFSGERVDAANAARHADAYFETLLASSHFPVELISDAQ